MKTKIISLFSIFLLVCNTLLSQLQFENADKLDLLKGSETIFVYRNSDDVKILTDVFKNYWTLSKVTLQSINEFEKKGYQPGFSYMMATTITSLDFNYTMLNLELWFISTDKKNKAIKFGNWQLYPTPETVNNLRAISFGDDKTEHSLFLKYFYSDPKCVEYNWSAGQIKNTLLWWQQHLLSNQKKPSKIIDPNLTILTSETLYIPDYVANKLIVKLNPNNNDNSQKTPVEELMAKYPYKYKIVTTTELSDLILSSKEPIYYLTCAARDIAFFTSIIRSTDGNELFYECLLANKFHLKPDHFEKIADYIKGAGGKKK